MLHRLGESRLKLDPKLVQDGPAGHERGRNAWPDGIEGIRTVVGHGEVDPGSEQELVQLAARSFGPLCNVVEGVPPAIRRSEVAHDHPVRKLSGEIEHMRTA